MDREAGLALPDVTRTVAPIRRPLAQARHGDPLRRQSDASDDASAAQLAAYRRLPPEARVRIALDLSEETRRVARTGIASHHPAYDAGQIDHALHRMVLGDALYRAAWPYHPLVAP